MFSKSLILRNYFSLLDSKLLDLWGSALKQIARGWGTLCLSMCLAGLAFAAEPAKSTVLANFQKNTLANNSSLDLDKITEILNESGATEVNKKSFE